jgi:hypothetical protein
MKRTDYCRSQGIAVTTLDYYLHREALRVRPDLARVTVTAESGELAKDFTLVLRNGRRIEVFEDLVDVDAFLNGSEINPLVAHVGSPRRRSPAPETVSRSCPQPLSKPPTCAPPPALPGCDCLVSVPAHAHRNGGRDSRCGYHESFTRPGTPALTNDTECLPPCHRASRPPPAEAVKELTATTNRVQGGNLCLWFLPGGERDPQPPPSTLPRMAKCGCVNTWHRKVRNEYLRRRATDLEKLAPGS